MGNVSERPSIVFYGMNGVEMCKIEAFTTNDDLYSINIQTPNRSGFRAPIYVNGEEVVTQGMLDEILEGYQPKA